MATTHSIEYSQGFDVESYLLTRFSSPGRRDDDEHRMRDFAVQKLHEHFSHTKPDTSGPFRVLDYGCGPVLANVISAARVATEVVLAEYTQEGRAALEQWLDNDPKAFNWSPYCEYVVQTLEGGSAQAAEEREKRLHSIVKGVVHCDITKDPPIENGYQLPYDVVISCLCLENATKTKEGLLQAFSRITTLVKSGGDLLLYFAETDKKDGLRSYWIGNHSYSALPVDSNFIHSMLEKDFRDIAIQRLTSNAAMVSKLGILGTMFFSAHKK